MAEILIAVRDSTPAEVQHVPGSDGVLLRTVCGKVARHITVADGTEPIMCPTCTGEET